MRHDNIMSNLMTSSRRFSDYLNTLRRIRVSFNRLLLIDPRSVVVSDVLTSIATLSNVTAFSALGHSPHFTPPSHHLCTAVPSVVD